MKDKKTETEIIAYIQEKLEESVDTIDAKTLYRLTRARKIALSSKKRGQFKWEKAFRLSFATLCTAAVVIVFTFWFQPSPTVQPVISGIEDVDILANRDNPEFFADIDFYIWLAEEIDQSG